MIFAWLYWDPNRFIFTIPFINHPIAWYGLFFVLGFIIGYFLMIQMLYKQLHHTRYIAERDIKDWQLILLPFINGPDVEIPQQKTVLSYFSEKTKFSLKKLESRKIPSQEERNQILAGLNEAISDPNSCITRDNIDTCFPKAIYSLKDLAVYLTECLMWFVVSGTLIGSRLGHVFFYDWSRYQQNPMEIFKIWEGGLASHGGAIGVILSIVLYIQFIQKRFPEIKFYTLLDHIVVPTALVGTFIRIGNFFNQEIVGTESTVPWAIIFGHPYDGSGAVPRHPAQLYEAACYLMIFFILGYLWIKKGEVLKSGYLTGIFFIMVFGSRFIIEFFKVSQGGIIEDTFLQTGQVLSIPFIIFGLFLLYSPPYERQVAKF